MQQGVTAGAGVLLPLHTHAHRHAAHLHPAGHLLTRRYPGAGQSMSTDVLYCQYILIVFILMVFMLQNQSISSYIHCFFC